MTATLRPITDRVLRNVLTPPAPLTVSQWADKYRHLSKESSAEPGPWRTDRTPYLRGIMDAMSDPAVERVVFMKCARIGGTEAGMNMLGYYMQHDPSPILVVQPTVETDAQGWSKEQLAPMLRDTPVLQGLVSDPRTRDSGNTILQKVFPGGLLTAVGANSGAGLRRRTVRIVLLDEVDAFPESAGTEGDPVALAIKRTETFPDRKIYLASTPLLKGLSRIEEEHEKSDQRLYLVPCPHCHHFQPLTWERLRYKDVREPVYVCAECERLIDESHKHNMNMAGRWEAQAESRGVAGFRVNQLYSEFDNARWPLMVDDWIECQGNVRQLQVFVNTALGESWEERGGAASSKVLESRVEAYESEVPARAVLLTAGVDVQDDRLEVKVKGWGRGEESWLIAWEQLAGDTTQADVWRQLDEFLLRGWVHESGVTLHTHATGIDSGHQTEMVYRFVKPRYGRRVFALKGSSVRYASLINFKASRKNNHRCPLFLIGTNAAKDLLYQRLRIDQPEPVTRPQPGYMHFPAWTDEEYGDYFDQLTAERPVRRQRNGRWFRQWELPRGRRNEATDCEVYALAALHLSRVNLDLVAKALEEGKPAVTPSSRRRRIRSRGVDR